MIFFSSLGWNPAQDEPVLSRYPKASIFALPRQEELLRYTALKAERERVSCVYLLHAIYANAAHREPTKEELDANFKGLLLEPMMKKLIADLESKWQQLRTGFISRIDIRTSFENKENRVRIEFGGWSFSLDYEYDDGMICLLAVEMRHPEIGVLVRDEERSYNEGFDCDPALYRKLDELLFTRASSVEDLPEIRAYIEQITRDDDEPDENEDE